MNAGYGPDKFLFKAHLLYKLNACILANISKLAIIFYCCFFKSNNSTFQAVVITDGSSSYAVFIYECGKLEWGEATIGWSDTRIFDEADYSRSSYSTRAGCLNYFDSNTIIYRLDKSEYT